MSLAILTPLAVVLGPLIAQIATPGDGSQWLTPLISNGPLAAMLAWMLWTQQQDRIADRKRWDDFLEGLRKQGSQIDRLARSILVLSLHLGSTERVANPQATAEAKEILRELGENTPR